jgi:hypothetical protein
MINIPATAIDWNERDVDDKIASVLLDLQLLHQVANFGSVLAAFFADQDAVADVTPVAID